MKMAVKRTVRLALLQLSVTKDKATNLKNATQHILKAKQAGAQIIALPECFNSPYGIKFFKEYAETVPGGETTALLSRISKEHGVSIVGGTIPELGSDGQLYNTCSVWDSNGEMVAKYRKMHLFDIDIPGGITFKESDSLSAGNELSMFTAFGCKIGLGICYDIRFPELAQIYRKRGCDLLLFPAAFNTTTGPLHWDLLQRARAVDNQLYVAMISPARGTTGYIAYGHSQVSDPWAKTIAKAGTGEEMLIVDLDLDECDAVRQQIPISKQRRTDIYDVVDKTAKL